MCSIREITRRDADFSFPSLLSCLYPILMPPESKRIYLWSLFGSELQVHLPLVSHCLVRSGSKNPLFVLILKLSCSLACLPKIVVHRNHLNNAPANSNESHARKKWTQWSFNPYLIQSHFWQLELVERPIATEEPHLADPSPSPIDIHEMAVCTGGICCSRSSGRIPRH